MGSRVRCSIQQSQGWASTTYSSLLIWTQFSDYILGQKFLVETDHKLLIPLLNTKHLDVLWPLILHFHLQLPKFNYSVFHVPGKLLYATDALSRASMPETEEPVEMESFVDSITKFTLPASMQRLDVYKQAQQDNPACAQVKEYCNNSGQPISSSPQQLRRIGSVSPSVMIFSCTIIILLYPKLCKRGDTSNSAYRSSRDWIL